MVIRPTLKRSHTEIKFPLLWSKCITDLSLLPIRIKLLLYNFSKTFEVSHYLNRDILAYFVFEERLIFPFN